MPTHVRLWTQDAVPPFPTDEAFAVLRRELGVRDLAQVFSYISPSPVASASIGQVHHATLKQEPLTVPPALLHTPPHHPPTTHPLPLTVVCPLPLPPHDSHDGAGLQGDAQGGHYRPRGGGQGAAAGHPLGDRNRPLRPPPHHAGDDRRTQPRSRARGAHLCRRHHGAPTCGSCEGV